MATPLGRERTALTEKPVGWKEMVIDNKSLYCNLRVERPIDLLLHRNILEVTGIELGTSGPYFVKLPRFSRPSRTDKGVHALQSSVHLDLESSRSLEYSPEYLTSIFNKYFHKNNLDIRIQSCQTVPDTFHARHSVKSRTYLYRFAVRKPCAETFKHNVESLAQIPFSEWKRKPEFDETRLRSALKLFLGVRDFRTFTTIRSKLESQAPPTVRTLHKLELSRGKPLLDAHYDPNNAHYTYWNITCKARSFLYKQIRRTVGVLLAVAQGHVSVDKVQHMFECPSHESWDPRASSAPPHGLYLVNVEYDPQDLMLCDNAGELLTNTDAKIDHSPTQT
ncbi:unnamed protein product [Timema podura]|uniref:tRNA pseudouridine synthase n=1 Tax=Timema podura TaxID=61482 RepID=A0ABN7NM02_TIMPD|nr:unnamed protein product [Timema podura]